jgi:CubicO group peptidase (beta-lactamase class C family)
MDRHTCRRTLALLEEGRAGGLHSGGQLYVSLRGKPVVEAAFGEARPGEPLRSEHLMLWMSSSKPVTAVGIAQLWERELLKLDDQVAKHLPEFAAGGKESVTIRHLLTHTGGIRTLETGWPKKSWDAIVAEICALRLEPRWVPGEKAGYHMASSWFILGELIQRLDGRPFARYVREEIFLPLGMGESWIGIDPDSFPTLAPRLVPIWDTAKTPPEMHRWHLAPRATHPNPGSNGYGPMRQLGRFYEALLGGGEWADRRILRPQTVEALVARHRTGLVDQTFRHVLDWGLGFIPNPAVYGAESVPYAYGPHASRRTYGHSGYRSSTAFADPEHGLVVALAVNGTPSHEAHTERFRTLCAAIYEDLGLAAAEP